jgi:gamma-glutamyltranspeptidase/glutathione hydrolase
MKNRSIKTNLLALLLASAAALVGTVLAVDAREWTTLVLADAKGKADPPDKGKGPPVDPGVKKLNKGVVSVSHPLAAQAGALMLERGGNAIDAAAAISFALNVVEPNFSGIGGGGFMMVHWAKTGETFIVDSRERAPAAATANMFSPTGTALPFAAASTSGVSVGVPGTLAGIDYALRHWGKKKLSETLAPAIKLAEEGFRINRFLAANIVGDGGRTTFQPETAAIFRPGGVPLAEGDLLVQPDLAKTFRLIAQHGPDVFYTGEIAPAIVEAQKRTRTTVPEHGVGRMTLADLANYQVAVRQPVAGHYRGWTLASMSPPSSGGLTVLQMLQMVEGFPMSSSGLGFGFGGPNTLHVMIEAMRLAFADRAVWMGDEDFVYVPKKGLLNPAYVATRSGLINLGSRIPGTPAAGNPLPYDMAGLNTKVMLAAIPAEPERDSHTTHFSVVDKHGNVVSYTTTIEAGWGTGITVPGYGFLLNNELTDFNFVPAFNAATGNPGANDVAPFKRPRSSMSPSILFKGDKPFAAYGSPGGATIINSVFNITLNLIDHGMTLQEAINAPRLSVTAAAGSVSCEGTADFIAPRFSIETQNALRALGHIGLGAMNTNGCTASIGSVQIVAIDLETGLQYGAADPRREGTVIDLPDPPPPSPPPKK